jgi:dUTP pyrophosphatase
MRLRFARLDAGLDLYAIEPAVLAPGERASIPTGLAVEIPDGHAGLLLARSGLAARHGVAIVNAPGLIDSGYRGELRVLLLNTDREQSFRIAPGERIAQLVVIAVAQPAPLEVPVLTESERGAGGLGSTGR